ncbi:energy transducer TonB [Sporocytophaga myxococcoides]|uniref:energy transducer TonB n=1 Tax=Sporocytophaga myxococcoides TaxID=153721 RepID=UPI0009DFA9EE
MGTTGEVTDLNIIRGLGNGFDEEVLRVMKLMPEWEPGYLDGKPIKIRKILPIKFSLPD